MFAKNSAGQEEEENDPVARNENCVKMDLVEEENNEIGGVQPSHHQYINYSKHGKFLFEILFFLKKLQRRNIFLISHRKSPIQFETFRNIS